MADLQTQLDEARQAYHQLMLGQQVVMIRDSNGEQIQYGNASASKLAAYISMLEMKLGVPTSCGPMQVWMGP
jgi:hypothetical protein